MMVSCTPDCNILPAEMIFSWPIQDVFFFISWKEKFNNPSWWATWREAWTLKEDVMRACMHATWETECACTSIAIPVSGWWPCILTEPTKWGKSGTVVEHYYQYWVKGDGLGCLTMWNKCFLHKFTPATVVIGIRYNLPPQHTKDDNLSAPWVTETIYAPNTTSMHRQMIPLSLGAPPHPQQH